MTERVEVVDALERGSGMEYGHGGNEVQDAGNDVNGCKGNNGLTRCARRAIRAMNNARGMLSMYRQ